MQRNDLLSTFPLAADEEEKAFLFLSLQMRHKHAQAQRRSEYRPAPLSPVDPPSSAPDGPPWSGGKRGERRGGEGPAITLRQTLHQSRRQIRLRPVRVWRNEPGKIP